MADHSKPTNASAYTDYTTQINARVDDALRGLDPARTTATNMPQYSVRWSSASNKWEIWSGTAWGDLAAEYAISISGTAGKLKTARTIALSGGATGTATAFDGSANITIPITALAWASITGAPAFATRWPAWTEVTAKPSTFPPAAHTHSIADITGASFVDKSGDTMSGSLMVAKQQATYNDAGLKSVTENTLDNTARIALIVQGDHAVELVTTRGSTDARLQGSLGALAQLQVADGTATSHAATLGQVNTIAGATKVIAQGAIGSFALMLSVDGVAYTPGQTTAGSNLAYATAAGDLGANPITATGTWKCFGVCASNASPTNGPRTTVWHRIA